MRNAGFDVSATTVDVSSRDSVLALVWLRPRIQPAGVPQSPERGPKRPRIDPAEVGGAIAESA
jgi:hypothetical protein